MGKSGILLVSSIVSFVLYGSLVSTVITIEWSEPIQITTSGNISGYHSLIQDSNGIYWLAFSYNNDIYVMNSTDGITYDTPIKVTNVGDAVFVSLIQDSNGTYLLAYHRANNAQYDIFTTTSVDGVTWTAPRLVLGGWIHQWEPSLLQDSSGKYWLAYNTYGGIYLINSLDFVSWSIPTQVVSDFMAHASLIQDTKGMYWISYYSHFGSWEIYIKNSSNGISWSAPTQVSPIGGPHEWNPRLLQDLDGTYWIVYVSETPDENILITSSPDGKVWDAPVQLTTDPSADNWPTIFQDSMGTYWLPFRSDRSGNWNIWMMTSRVKIEATLDIDPDTLNLESKGKWITAYIELPEGYDVNDINASIVELVTSGGIISVDLSPPPAVGDYDLDRVPDLMVKFDRGTVVGYLSLTDVDDEGTGTDYEAVLTITGELTDGTLFEGTDKIRVIEKGRK